MNRGSPSRPVWARTSSGGALRWASRITAHLIDLGSDGLGLPPPLGGILLQLLLQGLEPLLLGLGPPLLGPEAGAHGRAELRHDALQ
jgi:hypothetical protein